MFKVQVKAGFEVSMRFKIGVKYVAVCSIRDRDKVQGLFQC